MLDYFLDRWLTRRRSMRSRCTRVQTFRRKLEKYFSPIISAAKSSGKVERSSFRMVQMHLGRYFKYPELVSIYYDYILDTLEEFISRDWRLMTLILNEYAKRRLESYGYRIDNRGVFMYTGYANHRIREIEISFHEQVFPSCSLTKLLQKPFLFQDFECVKRLLRYIIPVTFGTNNSSSYIGRVIWRINNDPILGKAKFCSKLCRRYCNSLGARSKLLLVSIDFVLRKRGGSTCSSNCIESLTLFFEVIPDTWISLEEVTEFLRHSVKRFDCDLEINIQDFCNSFEQEFPQSGQYSQPRTLLHLSRCEVRKCLGLSRELPHGVQSLGIPKVLQDYILLGITA